jgi:hypothetical protein
MHTQEAATMSHINLTCTNTFVSAAPNQAPPNKRVSGNTPQQHVQTT